MLCFALLKTAHRRSGTRLETLAQLPADSGSYPAAMANLARNLGSKPDWTVILDPESRNLGGIAANFGFQKEADSAQK